MTAPVPRPQGQAQPIPPAPEFLQLYLELLQSRLRVGLLIGLFLVSAFGMVDWFTARQLFAPLMTLRLATSAALGLLWLYNQGGVSRRRQEGITLAGAYLVAAMLVARVVALGSGGGPHESGLYLVLIACLVLVPLRLPVALALADGVLAIYGLPVIWLKSVATTQEIIRTFYALGGAAALMLVANHLHRLALTRELGLRLEVERGRQELKALADSLEEQVKERTAGLRRSEERYRSLVESNPALIYTLGMDGSYTFLGPRCQAVLGHPPDEVLGRWFIDMVPPEEHRKCVRVFKRVRDHGEGVNDLEFSVIGKDGQRRDLMTSFAPYRDETGAVLGLIGTTMDVTEQRRLAREKERYRQGLEEALERLRQANFDTVRALAGAIEAKDPYTRGHAERVALLSLAIARKGGLGEDELTLLQYAAVLHDVGKIGVRGLVLNKAGPLTEEEYAHVKLHSQWGDAMLAEVGLLAPVRPLIRSHHERFDGGGYPDGLQGEAIPLLSRVMAVADSFDAMLSRRPYRDPLSLEETWRRLREGAGSQFDPQVLSWFQQAAGDDLLGQWEGLARQAEGNPRA